MLGFKEGEGREEEVRQRVRQRAEGRLVAAWRWAWRLRTPRVGGGRVPSRLCLASVGGGEEPEHRAADGDDRHREELHACS